MYSNCLRRIVVNSRGLGLSGNVVAVPAARNFGGRSLGMTSVALESSLGNLSVIAEKKQALEPVLFWTTRGYVTSVVERSAARWSHRDNNNYKSISFNTSTTSFNHRSSLVTQHKSSHSLETRNINYMSSGRFKDDPEEQEQGQSQGQEQKQEQEQQKQAQEQEQEQGPEQAKEQAQEQGQKQGQEQGQEQGKEQGQEQSSNAESTKEKLTNLYGYGNTFFGSIIVGFIAFGTWCFYQGLTADDVHREVSDTGLYNTALEWLGKVTDYEAEGPFLQPNVTGSNRPTLVIDASEVYKLVDVPNKGWIRKRRPKSYFLIGTLYANYELVIWHDNESRDSVQSNPEYLTKLDPHSLVNHLFLENVSVKHTKKVKNISRLGRDESRVIVVTSDPGSYSPDSQRNIIAIPKWDGNYSDTDLFDLVFFLDFLVKRGGEGDLTEILEKVKESGSDPILIGRPLRLRWERKTLHKKK